MQGASREALAQGNAQVERELADASADDARALSTELFAVTDVLDAQVGLRRALSDPAFEADRKSALAASLFEGKVSARASSVVDVLVRARWSRMRDLADAAEELAALAEIVAASKDGHADETEDQLFRFGRIIEAEPGLRAALGSQALPDENKTALVAALLKDRTTPSAARLVARAATRPRGRTPEDAIGTFCGVATQRTQRLTAQVQAAGPLSDGEMQRLRGALSGMYGHDVHLQVEIDENLVGGVVVRVGDEVIDGSIAGRLADARQRLR